MANTTKAKKNEEELNEKKEKKTKKSSKSKGAEKKSTTKKSSKQPRVSKVSKNVSEEDNSTSVKKKKPEIKKVKKVTDNVVENKNFVKDEEEEKLYKEIEEVEDIISKSKEKKKKKKNIFIRIIRFFLILALLGIATVAFLLYGPWPGFRDWYITSAMTTMNHQWLATMFFSQATIDEVMSRNKIIEVEGVTDASKIKTNEETKNVTTYANEYEKAILERDPNHKDYKIIDIKGKAYNGFLAVVYDPSKVHAMVTSKLNVCGEYVTKMAEREGAVLAINGGGFDDPNYSSNGGTPTGITFSRGTLVTNKNNAGSAGGLIGFTKDNVLTIGRIGATEAQNLGMRDAVTCGPFLIINGKSSSVVGNGGWGQAARTVIGQRQDGIVLMLVLNGRNYKTGILGADMDDLIEIMERYGAYNAACLDGGTSSVMVENGNIINDPIDSTGAHRTRFVPTAFGVFLNE